ncbi:TrkA-N domain dehydrogenase [Penicillium nucicola]|uniref:TrkA-N domain dehydrogenase n=1 Tax=Penicillium nucicola TaxID=1850975 RepID=UPI0025459F5C|nr:TrkA-N domain dehydrogenase [Penicillium nucicola]KAJ5758049.1 TrkA-N domain dehydrogenase [Penicillium nucicola]
MRFLIIGGSGRTGKLVINELLERSHEVTALVRSPTALEERSGLDIVQGTPLNIWDVNRAFNTNIPDVVIVTLSALRETDSPFAKPISPPRMMADSNANIVKAMKEFGVHKIVVLQSFGTGSSWANMPCAMRLLMSKSNMIYSYDDHNAAEKEIRDSGVTFVFVRPSRLVESDITQIKEWPTDGKGVGLMGSASRISVARFLVDAALDTKWDSTAPVITN